MMRFGIDVSHHQRPGDLPWATFAERSSFCIVRGSYGTMRDGLTAQHVKRARAAGLKVGLYHFYRPAQSVNDQLAVFRTQLDAAGITTGDIIPTIDIEADPFPKPGIPVTTAWQGSVLEFIDAMVTQLGDCMVYITQREFVMLGSPEWLLSRPLWVAHYTPAQHPATPANKPWRIWQHRVGPYNPDGPGGYDTKRPELDQNRLQGEMPLIGHTATVEPSALPPDDGRGDDGLEELIAKLQGGSWARTQDAVGLAGANLREFESGPDDEPEPVA